jgi:hypothetical protein
MGNRDGACRPSEPMLALDDGAGSDISGAALPGGGRRELILKIAAEIEAGVYITPRRLELAMDRLIDRHFPLTLRPPPSEPRALTVVDTPRGESL